MAPGSRRPVCPPSTSKSDGGLSGLGIRSMRGLGIRDESLSITDLGVFGLGDSYLGLELGALDLRPL